jgi:hypothetical protein
MGSPIRVVPYTDEWANAVRAFNGRIASSGQELPETPHPNWMPRMEIFLAVEDDTVRGGYILRRQCFSVSGRDTAVAHYRLPLSEGVIDRRYAALGLRMVRDALAREQRLYCLGMGGWDKPLPQMLKRLGWRMCEVPFYFKVLHPSRFLRNLRVLRTSGLRRLALDAAAFSGAGWLAMRLMGQARSLRSAEREIPADFADWPDPIWEAGRESCAMIARRDAATLDELYPPGDARFVRVRTGGGWAVVLDTQMRDHRQFGNMRVGSIVDGLAARRAVAGVVREATAVLEERGVDLVISNQLHAEWSGSLLEAGFRKGPSNFLLALSPALAQLAAGAPESAFHLNRGDGDGPIHL